MKYGLWNTTTDNWVYADSIDRIGLDYILFKHPKDGRFATDDMNVAYRYLEHLKLTDSYGRFMEVRERTDQ